METTKQKSVTIDREKLEAVCIYVHELAALLEDQQSKRMGPALKGLVSNAKTLKACIRVDLADAARTKKARNHFTNLLYLGKQ